MKKINRKKKKDKKDYIVIISIVLITVLIIGGIFGLNHLRSTNMYSEIELQHDHDGDGIPDHGIDFHNYHGE